MAVSAIDPMGQAFTHMARVAFKPFDIAKWFTLGFCAWLAMLGEGGSPNFNGFSNVWKGSTSGPGAPSPFAPAGSDPVWAWITGHWPLVLRGS